MKPLDEGEITEVEVHARSVWCNAVFSYADQEYDIVFSKSFDENIYVETVELTSVIRKHDNKQIDTNDIIWKKIKDKIMVWDHALELTVEIPRDWLTILRKLTDRVMQGGEYPPEEQVMMHMILVQIRTQLRQMM
jgi:hypothetical protein